MANFDPNQLKITQEVSRKDVLFCVAKSDATEDLFIGSSDFSIYRATPGAEKPTLQPLGKHKSYVTGTVCCGDQLITGAYDKSLRWWDISTNTQIRCLENAHSKWIRDVNVTPDRQHVISVADDMICRVWDAKDGSLQSELRGHQPQTPHHFPSMLFCTAVSADGRLLATADKTGHIVVWELETGKQLTTLEAPTMYTWDPKARIHSIGGIRSLAFSPNSQLLAAGGIGQIGNIDHLGALARIEVFDWHKGERTHEFPGDQYKGLVEQLRFSPDGKTLLAAGGDHGGFMKFIDLESSKLIKQDKAPMHIHDLVVTDDWNSIFAVGHNRMAVWSAA